MRENRAPSTRRTSQNRFRTCPRGVHQALRATSPGASAATSLVNWAWRNPAASAPRISTLAMLGS